MSSGQLSFDGNPINSVHQCTAFTVYNLTQGIDKDGMERKVAAYQKANSDDILRNQALKVHLLQTTLLPTKDSI